MKKLLLGFLILVAAGCTPAEQPGSSGQALSAPTNRYLVVYKSEALPTNVGDRVQRAGGRVLRHLGEVGAITVTANAAAAARLAADTDVLAVGPEQLRKLPRVHKLQHGDTASAVDHFLFPYQWDMRRIGAPAAAMRLSSRALRASTVAVLDVGVADWHPDLQASIVDSVATNYCQEDLGLLPGFPIYTQLIDFDLHPDWSPELGCTGLLGGYLEDHGTHVSGTVAANGGVVGVGPGLSIAAYKVFDRYRFRNAAGNLEEAVGAFDGPIFNAIIDAAQKGYGVINMSLGGTVDRTTADGEAAWQVWDRVTRFATRMGTLIVAAAGNESQRSSLQTSTVPGDLPSVLAVSASGTSSLIVSKTGLYDAAPGSDTFAFYSNYGKAIDLAAPGGDCGPAFTGENWNVCVDPRYWILSSGIWVEAGGEIALGWEFMIGTSMASPHVAGVAGLVRAQHPRWRPEDVREQLLDTAERIGPRLLFGAGLVDAERAVSGHEREDH